MTSNGNGTFNYTPKPSFFGDDSFTYRATDGTNLSVPATVTIHVASRTARLGECERRRREQSGELA